MKDDFLGMNQNEPPPPDPIPETEVESPPTAPEANTTPPQLTPAKSAFGDNMGSEQWAMFLHLSQLAGFVLPGMGFAAPIVIWLVQKTPFPELDAHGKMVSNWMISVLIYSVLAGLIMMITCGVGIVLFAPLVVLATVFPVIGAMKAKDGVLWPYPLTIPIIK